VAALEDYRQSGARLVLATSSWQYVAAEATRCFELDDYVSSQFDVDPQVSATTLDCSPPWLPTEIRPIAQAHAHVRL
jgi:hypothetical protein